MSQETKCACIMGDSSLNTFNDKHENYGMLTNAFYEFCWYNYGYIQKY